MNKSRSAKIAPPSRPRITKATRRSADLLRQGMHEGLRDLSHDCAILAVGCEEAFMATHLAEYAASVTVLDTSAAQIAQLARRFPEISFVQHDPASPLPFAEGAFDAIWCCELLDRVFDPAAVLRELHRVLAPGGRLLATVPNRGTAGKVLRAIFRGEEPMAAANPRVRDFTPRSLAKLARESGFLDVHVRSAGGRFLSRPGVVRRLLLRARKSPAGLTLKVLRRPQLAAGKAGAGDEAPFAGRSRAA